MARIDTAKCKQCRQVGEKLFLRGERCFGAKCGMVRKAYPPGVRGKSMGQRRKVSEFGRQLMQKQRIKKIYGVLERQFKKYFREAQAQKGDARENLMKKLEMRLDNVVFRLGLAGSRQGARQMVNHGHILVNGKKVTISSYGVKPGEIISLRERTKKSKLVEGIAASIKKQEVPGWMSLDKEKLEAKIVGVPSGDDLGDLAPIGLIVEFYSR